VKVSVNGLYAGATRAADARPDISAAFPLAGPNHGFTTTVPAPAGANQVCVDAVPIGPGSYTRIGCQTVQLGAVPIAPPALIAGAGLWSLPTGPAGTQGIRLFAADGPRPGYARSLATTDAWVYRLPFGHRAGRAAHRYRAAGTAH